MLELHNGPTRDLLGKVIGPGDEPVVLVTPVLPSQTVLDQIVIVARQVARELRIVTPLYGLDPFSTASRIDLLIKLNELGVRIKTAERGILPSILTAPPDGCLLLPYAWGLSSNNWGLPIVVRGSNAEPIYELANDIWAGSGGIVGRRLLLTMRRWLDEVAMDGRSDEDGESVPGEVELSELTLFDKRRGGGRRPKKKQSRAWWTFHGTADDRVNPFLPVRSWALQKETHHVIRFPLGRRPTGVKTGDDIFFVVNSRLPGGDLESFIVGHGIAVAYRPLVDDATDDERAVNEYLERFPHSVRLEHVQFIRGAIGEGIPAHKLMSRLGASTFESTWANKQKGKGNTDPFKSINQKSILLLTGKCADEASRLLSERMNVLGSVTAAEIDFHN